MKPSSMEAVWCKFNDLAAASDAARVEEYESESTQFLTSLVREFTVNFNVPNIRSAQDFSECIVELRQDYRECNQYLMRLMIDSETDEATRLQKFDQFIANCIWVELVEAAQNFPK
jgi:hypothetical protein